MANFVLPTNTKWLGKSADSIAALIVFMRILPSMRTVGGAELGLQFILVWWQVVFATYSGDLCFQKWLISRFSFKQKIENCVAEHVLILTSISLL
jgi:hypothetical protein